MNLESVWLASFTTPTQFARTEVGKDDSGELRITTGVASSEIVDRSGTVVDYKSLKKAGKAFMKRRNRSMYVNHGWWIPVGRTLQMSFNDESKMTEFRGTVGRGFHVPVAAGTMRFSTQKMHVDEIWEMMQQELLTSDSIAFLGDV